MENYDKEIKRIEGLMIRNQKEIKEITENLAADERKYQFLLQEKSNFGWFILYFVGRLLKFNLKKF
jgi:hypothetical protein